MSTATLAIEVYSNETAAEEAAARMRLKPQLMKATVEEVRRRATYDDRVTPSDLIATLAPTPGSLWVVIGRK